MKIEFTKEQFGDLLKITYLGNWFANAIHDGSKDDPRDKEMDAIDDYILSFAKEFGFGDYVEYDKKFKKHFPTATLDAWAEKYIDEFNEDNFWEELFYRMSERDFARAYSPEDTAAMDMHERFEKEEPFREQWDTEINEYGVSRLEINTDKDRRENE